MAAAVIDLLTADPAFEELRDAVAGCTRCVLSQSRTQTVFGSGSPTADLMFVGEAPGFHEDKQGIPFVGSAGQLLGKLLAGIDLTREQVFVANVLKCRPPGNRDPQPDEIAACESHLFRQIELIEPKVICTLGNFATKLLSGKPDGITKVHGREQEVVLGGTRVLLFPIFHPAAALYTPSMLDLLQADFRKLPALLGQASLVPEEGPAPPLAPARATPEPAAVQLGLFRLRGKDRGGHPTTEGMFPSFRPARQVSPTGPSIRPGASVAARIVGGRVVDTEGCPRWQDAGGGRRSPRKRTTA